MSNVLITIKHDAKQIANDAIFASAMLYGVYTLKLDTKFAQTVGLNPYSSTIQAALLSGLLFGSIGAIQREAIKMKLPVNIL